MIPYQTKPTAKSGAASNAAAADDNAELRSSLSKRLAVAGGLVAVLLAVLAFFDRLSAPDEPELPVYSKPIPVAPRKELTQPVTPADKLPDPPPATAEPERPVSAVAETDKAARNDGAKMPSAKAESMPPAKPAAPVVESAPALARPAPPQPPAVPVATKPLQPPPIEPPPPVAVRPAAREVLPPTPARPIETPAAKAAVVTPPRLFANSFGLQAGVFNNVRQAEELHAKLTLNGIPSTLEARVQVGPFKSREEADRAREKMKTIGVDAMLIPPRGR